MIKIIIFIVFSVAGSAVLFGCSQESSDTGSQSKDHLPASVPLALNNQLKKTNATNDNYINYDDVFLTPEEIEKRKIEISKRKLLLQEALETTGKMITIPAGEFEMGSNSASFYEEPMHPVSVAQFQLGEKEVTQKQWQLIMGNNPSYFKGCDNCPVEKVSWNDIQEYIELLNRKTGQNYRLPTEAEWEYACRSGGIIELYCGGYNESSLGWYIINSNRKSNIVGQKRANELGLYDMTGNVWEWVQDCWNESYKNAPTNGEARLSGDCSNRVLRGGSWDNEPYDLRATYRNWGGVKERKFTYGFRLAHD